MTDAALRALHDHLAARPVMVRVEVGPAALAAFRGGHFPDELTALVPRGLPPGLGPPVCVVYALARDAWQAIGATGEIMAGGEVRRSAAPPRMSAAGE